jgi:hypothetical protein
MGRCGAVVAGSVGAGGGNLAPVIDPETPVFGD